MKRAATLIATIAALLIAAVASAAPFAYVTPASGFGPGRNVTVIDLADNVPVDQAYLGQAGYGLVLDEARNRLYATGPNRVTVIDATTLYPLAEITHDALSYPRFGCLSRDSSAVYVADATANAVFKIDADAMEIVKMISVPAPWKIEEGDGVLYVASMKYSRVYAVKFDTGEILADAAVPSAPDVVYDADAGLIYAVGFTGEIAVLTETLDRVGTVAIGGKPYSADLAGNGLLFVTCIGTDEIYAVDARNLRVAGVIRAGYREMPREVACGKNKAVVTLYRTQDAMIIDVDTLESARVYVGPVAYGVASGKKDNTCEICGEDHGEPPAAGLVWCHQHNRWHPKDHSLVGNDEDHRHKEKEHKK